MPPINCCRTEDESSWKERDDLDAQQRVGAWSAWVVILLSWVALFIVLALIFRATACNRSSEAGAPADSRVWTSSLNRWRDLGDWLQAERESPGKIQ
jgi:hypothetical protein